MERLKKIFNKEFSKIGEAAVVLAFFTLLSQFLGIFRDRFLAGNIGTGETLDMYYAAFRVPDLLLVFGASLVSVSMLMPFFTKKLQQSQESAKKFIDDIFTTFFIFIIFTSLVLLFLMPVLIQHLFPGFSPEAIRQTIQLSRIMLLSPILLGVSNLFATVTQTFKRFFVYALTPVFYNIGIIIGILLLYPVFGVKGLAYGVVLGATMHIGIQLPVIFKEGFFPRLSRHINWKDIKKVIEHSLPRTITLSLTKIVFLIFVSIASTLIAGTISVFNLSYNLQSVPLAIIGISYSVAAFPILVDYFNAKKYEEFMAHVVGPIRQIVFWSLPVIALFIVLRAQIVRVILGTGRFDWADTRLTAASLALFILSVVAQSIVFLLIRAYYAAGKTWKPFFITLFSSALTVAFAFLFISLFKNITSIRMFFETLLRIKGVQGSSVIMLSLAFSVGMFVNLIIFWHFFTKDFRYQHGRYGIRTSFFQSAIASLLIGLVSYFSLQITHSWFSMNTTLGVFGHGLVSGLLGIIVGIIFLRVIGNKEMKVFLNVLHQKFWNKKLFAKIDTYV